MRFLEQVSRTPEQNVCIDATLGKRQTVAPSNGADMRLHPLHRLSLLAAAVLLVSSPVSARAQAASPKAALSPDLQSAKAALSKYSDPFAAIKDGYFSTVACMDF